MLKLNEVNIRDPFVMFYEGKYYLYGTRSRTCWGTADGFDCYISGDLENWEGPIEIFRRPDGFFADREYWAPECISYQGAFYLITTFGAKDRKKGIYVLRSETPAGPFEIYSGRLTPQDWACIDGTIYFEDGQPILVFSHSFEDSPEGDMCAVVLSADLKQAVGRPFKLFSAREAKWAHPVPFAKEEFGMEGEVYFTDGPCLMKLEDGKLYMTWSSWGTCGYAVGTAVSEGGIRGPWRQLEEPIFPVNGGHGMMFKDKDGRLRFTLHFPNEKYKEHPMIADMTLKDGALILELDESRQQANSEQIVNK